MIVLREGDFELLFDQLRELRVEVTEKNKEIDVLRMRLREQADKKERFHSRAQHGVDCLLEIGEALRHAAKKRPRSWTPSAVKDLIASLRSQVEIRAKRLEEQLARLNLCTQPLGDGFYKHTIAVPDPMELTDRTKHHDCRSAATGTREPS